MNAKVARANQTRVRQCECLLLRLQLNIRIERRGVLNGLFERDGDGEREMVRCLRADSRAQDSEDEEEKRADTNAGHWWVRWK